MNNQLLLYGARNYFHFINHLANECMIAGATGAFQKGSGGEHEAFLAAGTPIRQLFPQSAIVDVQIVSRRAPRENALLVALQTFAAAGSPYAALCCVCERWDMHVSLY